MGKDPTKKGIAAVVMVLTPKGVPMVKDPTKPLPQFWKLPGGKGELGEDGRMCAARELEGETGIVVDEDDLREIQPEEDRGDHVFSAFCIQLPQVPKGILETGDEGEEVRIFRPAEIRKMRGEILRYHLGLINRTLGMFGL